MRASIQGSASINKVLPSANNPGSYETIGYGLTDDVRVLKSLSPLLFMKLAAHVSFGILYLTDDKVHIQKV